MIAVQTYSQIPQPCDDPDCLQPLPHDHLQDYAPTLCQKIVLRYKDEYCSVFIARPAEWDYDWCRGCIQAVPWPPDYAQKLVAKGLLLPPGDNAGAAQAT